MGAREASAEPKHERPPGRVRVLWGHGGCSTVALAGLTKGI